MPGPVLALAHRIELLDQAADRCGSFGFVPELEKAEARASMAASFVLASVQSLQGDRLRRFNPDHFGFIWIDECHHAPADTYRNILNHFRGAKVYGCTATLDRLDGEGYEKIFEKISFEKSLAELTEGFDCRDIDTIVLLRPTQSRALLCQQIGRATRLCPGKEFGLLLDFFWLTARHKLCAFQRIGKPIWNFILARRPPDCENPVQL